MWRIAGEDAALAFDFTSDGQFVVPDPGSVKVTVRDNMGVVMQDWDKAVQPDPVGTNMLLVLPAAINFLSASDDMENRFVTVTFTVGGKPHMKMVNYRLHHFLPISVTPEQVRSLLGAAESEIPSYEIDIYGAYYALLAIYSDTLPQALKSSTKASLSANNAIALQAALEQVPALAAKLAQSESQDNATNERMRLDIPALKRMLEAKLADEMTLVVASINGPAIASASPYLALTTPADVITGA